MPFNVKEGDESERFVRDHLAQDRVFGALDVHLDDDVVSGDEHLSQPGAEVQTRHRDRLCVVDLLLVHSSYAFARQEGRTLVVAEEQLDCAVVRPNSSIGHTDVRMPGFRHLLTDGGV